MKKKLKFKIEKKEILYSLTGLTILLLWFLWIKNIIAPYLEVLHPFIAMWLFDIGLVIGLFLMSFVLNTTKMKLKVSLIVFLILMGVDIIAAPYLVSYNGIINTNTDMWYTSSDVGWASFYQLFIPNLTISILNVSLLWFMVYIITPTILMFILPILIGNPKIIKKAFN